MILRVHEAAAIAVSYLLSKIPVQVGVKYKVFSLLLVGKLEEINHL